MCKKYGIKIALFLLLFLSTGFGQDIRVENVFVPQDSIKKMIGSAYEWLGILFYDLIYKGDSDTLDVWAEYSNDSGKTWLKGTNHIWYHGDYGKTVKGVNKRIEWSCLGPEGLGPCLIKVFATDILTTGGPEPPREPRLGAGVVFLYLGGPAGNTVHRYVCRALIMRNPYDDIVKYKMYSVWGDDTIYINFFEDFESSSDSIVLVSDTFELSISNQDMQWDTTLRCTYISAIDSYGREGKKVLWCTKGMQYPSHYDTTHYVQPVLIPKKKFIEVQSNNKDNLKN